MLAVERDPGNVSRMMNTECQDRKTKFHEKSSNARDIPLAEYMSAQDDPFSYRREDSGSQSPSASWKTAITARVNSLWKYADRRQNKQRVCRKDAAASGRICIS